MFNLPRMKFSFRFINLAIAFVYLFTQQSHAQDGSLDLSFNTQDAGFQATYGANDHVYALAVQTDGKILVGGAFISYNGVAVNKLARLNPDGSLDQSFNASSANISGDVKKIVLQPNGRILVAGSFGITRLLPDGNPDPGFNTGGSGTDGPVNDVLLLSTGQIIIGGAFTSFNGLPGAYLIRLTSTGTRDAAFNNGQSGPDGEVNCIVLQPNARIMVGGVFNNYNSQSALYMARLSVNGSFDGGFNNNGLLVFSPVHAIAYQADGKILAGGAFGLTRLNNNGSPDSGFDLASANAQIFDPVNRILLQSDQKIMVSWGDYSYDPRFGNPGPKIARRLSTGQNDPDFVYAVKFVKDHVYDMALQADGQLLVAQTFDSRIFRDFIAPEYAKGLPNGRINRYAANGTKDISFNIPSNIKGANNAVKVIRTQTDGKILIGGYFFLYNGEHAPYLLRLLPDGSRDASFNPSGSGPDNAVKDIAVLPDGKIMIAGNFTSYNGQSRGSIVRLMPDGSIDPGFLYTAGNGLAYDFIEQIKPINGNKLLGGKFSNFNQTLFLLTETGSIDPVQPAEIRVAGPFRIPAIYSIAIQDDGKWIIGGDFDGVKDWPYQVNLMRLLPTGGIDDAFNTPLPSQFDYGANSTVRSICIQPDQKILIGGEFTQYKSLNATTNAGRILRLKPDGQPDTLFNAGGNGFDQSVLAVYRLSDGKIMVGGSFTTYNGVPVSNLARLLPDGRLDSSFNTGMSGPDARVLCLESIPGQPKLMIGGDFTGYNFIGKNHVARLLTCSEAPVLNQITLCPAQLPYTWNGISITEAGEYEWRLPRTGSCDSITRLTVQVVASPAGQISGPARVCAYTPADTAWYRVDATAGATIIWSVSDASRMQLVSRTDSSALGIKFINGFSSGTLYARVTNAICGSYVRRSLAISTALPATPSAISTSAANICPVLAELQNGNNIPIVYSIRKVATATSYNWSSQAGTTYLYHPNGAGENDTIVHMYITDPVLFSTSAISVQAVNDCGPGSTRSLTITRRSPSVPSAISGPANVCSFIEPSGMLAVYSITPVSGVDYFWTIPEFAVDVNGQNSPTVSFRYPSSFTSGTISVIAINGCGASSPRKLSVKKFLAATPGAISALDVNDCPTRQVRYSFSSYPAYATSLVWTVPAGASIASGQGTTNIIVNYPNTGLSGQVSVQSFNDCSASSVRKLTVNISACDFLFSKSGLTNDTKAEQMENDGINIYPNPAGAEARVEWVTKLPGQITYRIFDAAGKQVTRFTANPNEPVLIGQGFMPGVYLVEAIQGMRKKTSRLVKL